MSIPPIVGAKTPVFVSVTLQQQFAELMTLSKQLSLQQSCFHAFVFMQNARDKHFHTLFFIFVETNSGFIDRLFAVEKLGEEWEERGGG